MFVCLFFFFKQKTAYEMRISDWSSDVCSSDLQSRCRGGQAPESLRYERQIAVAPIGHAQQHHDDDGHENEPGESRRTAGEAGKAGADADGEVDDVGAGRNCATLSSSVNSSGVSQRFCSTSMRRANGRTPPKPDRPTHRRSEEHTSELQSLMSISYAVFRL